MRRQYESKKSVILDFIDEYYNEYNEIPAVRNIAEGTGITLETVHCYLISLKESGELEYNGSKSISTKRIDLESRHTSAPVLGYVRCGEGEEETEEVIEYIRLPESLVGAGVTLTPLAFLIVSPDGKIDMKLLAPDSKNMLDKAIDMAPGIIDKIRDAVASKKDKEEEAPEKEEE